MQSFLFSSLTDPRKSRLGETLIRGPKSKVEVRPWTSILLPFRGIIAPACSDSQSALLAAKFDSTEGTVPPFVCGDVAQAVLPLKIIIDGPECRLHLASFRS